MGQKVNSNYLTLFWIPLGPTCDFVSMEDEKSLFWINTDAISVIHHLINRLTLRKQDTKGISVHFPKQRNKKKGRCRRQKSIKEPLGCVFFFSVVKLISKIFHCTYHLFRFCTLDSFCWSPYFRIYHLNLCSSYCLERKVKKITAIGNT